MDTKYGLVVGLYMFSFSELCIMVNFNIVQCDVHSLN